MTTLQVIAAILPLLVGLPAVLGAAVAWMRPGRWVRPLAVRRWDLEG